MDSSISSNSSSSVDDRNLVKLERDDDESTEDSNEVANFEAVVLKSAISSGILTEAMVEEEEKLIELAQVAEVVDLDKSVKEVTAPSITLEDRYGQLQELLTRSKFYTQYLVNKMDMTKNNSTKVKSLAQIKKEKKMLTYSKPIEPKSERVTRTVKAKAKTQPSPKPGQPIRSGKRELKSPQTVKKVKLDENFVEDDEFEQPRYLTGDLRDYQKEGYQWMKCLYENGLNGILGDEMGLGKTIQCIALLCHLIEMGVQGPFLICAPLSTLPNWIVEFGRFAPQIPVILYHGTRPERIPMWKTCNRLVKVDDVMAYPVVVTSYEMAISDVLELKKRTWKYVIIDEGHRIKNTNCVLLKRLKELNSYNRLLLTGTPLQNNLTELWSLLNFLMPELFNDFLIFQSWFDATTLNEDGSAEQIVAQERENSILNTLHEILSPFLLRRIKTDVDLNIPPKRELHIYASMSRMQFTLYKHLFDGTIKALMSKHEKNFDKPAPIEKGKTRSESSRIARRDARANPTKSDTKNDVTDDFEMPMLLGGKSLSEVNVKLTSVFTQMRKCCYHPYLLEHPIDPFTQQFRVDEQIVTSSGKMLLLDALLKQLKERGHKVLIFSQYVRMLNILEDYCCLRQYAFSRLDGSRKMDNRKENIDTFNSDPDTFIFLISTRAGGLGINLTAADTVIIYDSDWNPQCDLQAMDRCHRIGQTKPVIVYRLITANSIDQRIVERAGGKRKLEKMIIRKGRFKMTGTPQNKSLLTSLNPDELLDLLKSSDHDGTIKAMGRHVFSPEEMDIIFNRDFGSNNTTSKDQALRVKVIIPENGQQ